jgi:hypothetical protein
MQIEIFNSKYSNSGKAGGKKVIKFKIPPLGDRGKFVLRIFAVLKPLNRETLN